MVQALLSSHAPAAGAPPPQVPLLQTSFTVHGLLSLQAPVRLVPTQLPVAQVSFVVHGLPSSHAPVVVVPAHVPVAEQVSLSVQALKSLHAMGGDEPVQVPFWQVPVTGQPNPAKPRYVQAVPLATLVPVPQTPVVGLHTPVRHGLSTNEQRGKPRHTPASTQRSPWVQRLLSLQSVPASAPGYEHSPVEGLQVPGPAKHVGGELQPTAVPRQAPAEHRSFVVHASESSHPASSRNA